MHYLFFVLLSTLIIGGCGSRNVFQSSDAGHIDPLQSALHDLEQGNPDSAYRTSLDTLPKTQQTFISNAVENTTPGEGADSEAFAQDMQEKFSTLSTEERASLPILSQAMIEKEGVSFLGLSEKLASIENDSTSLVDECAPDANFKALIDAVAAARSGKNLEIATHIATFAAYTVQFTVFTDVVIVTQLTPYETTPNVQLILNGAFATLSLFGFILKEIDTDGDYKISAAESAAYFSDNPAWLPYSSAYGNARRIYMILKLATYFLNDFKTTKEKFGHPIKDIDKAITRINEMQNQLESFQLAGTVANPAPSSLACSDESRTVGSSIACVQQWLVARSNCKL